MQQLAISASPLSRRKVLSALGATALAGFAAPLFSARFAWAVTDEEVEAAQAEADAAYARLQELQIDLDIKSNAYYEAVAEVEAAQAAMDDCQRRIDECTSEIERLKRRLAKRVKSDYMTGGSTFADILFGSTSFSAFVNNMQISAKMSQDDTDTVVRTQALREEVEAEKAEYARQEAIAEAKRAEAQTIMEEAEAEVAEMQGIYNRLSATAAQLLAQRRAEEEARLRAIAEEEARQRAAEEEERRRREAENNPSSGNNEGGSSDPDPEPEPDPEPDVPYYAPTGNAIVDRALMWVGTGEYVWAACSSAGKFDCSGLVAWAVTNRYQRIGTTWTFWNNNYGWFPRVSNPQPGDICVVHTATRQHTGIYYHDGLMIHAADYGIGVIISGVWPDMVFCRYSGPVY